MLTSGLCDQRSRQGVRLANPILLEPELVSAVYRPCCQFACAGPGAQLRRRTCLNLRQKSCFGSQSGWEPPLPSLPLRVWAKSTDRLEGEGANVDFREARPSRPPSLAGGGHAAFTSLLADWLRFAPRSRCVAGKLSSERSSQGPYHPCGNDSGARPATRDVFRRRKVPVSQLCNVDRGCAANSCARQD